MAVTSRPIGFISSTRPSTATARMTTLKAPARPRNTPDSTPPVTPSLANKMCSMA